MTNGLPPTGRAMQTTVFATSAIVPPRLNTVPGRVGVFALATFMREVTRDNSPPQTQMEVKLRVSVLVLTVADD